MIVDLDAQLKALVASSVDTSSNITIEHHFGVDPTVAFKDSEHRLLQHTAATIEFDAQTPDLQQIINAWPTLPPTIRAGIVAMVKAAYMVS